MQDSSPIAQHGRSMSTSPSPPSRPFLPSPADLPAPRHRVASLARWLVVWLLPGLLLALWVTPVARADDDHDRARAAVASGQVLPLRKVLEALERQQGAGQGAAQVLEVELEERRGRWHYEIKLLQADGRVTKIRLDARTAEPLRAESLRGERDR